MRNALSVRINQNAFHYNNSKITKTPVFLFVFVFAFLLGSHKRTVKSKLLYCGYISFQKMTDKDERQPCKNDRLSELTVTEKQQAEECLEVCLEHVRFPKKPCKYNSSSTFSLENAADCNTVRGI